MHQPRLAPSRERSVVTALPALRGPMHQPRLAPSRERSVVTALPTERSAFLAESFATWIGIALVITRIITRSEWPDLLSSPQVESLPFSVDWVLRRVYRVSRNGVPS